jgi:uncharacterized protein with GYD domain
MPKYLYKFTYTPEALRGLLKEGATSRYETVKNLTEGMGGKLEAFYFAWGEADGYVICDFPDAATGAALSLVVNAAGPVHLSTTPLITPEEMDQAAQKTGSIDYHPPGS